MSHEDNGAALGEVLLSLKVYLGHKRACRVYHRQVSGLRSGLDGLGHPVSTENRDRSWPDFVDLVDETCPFRLQVFDDMPIVHDFVPDKDRRLVLLDRAFYDRNCANNPGAKSAWLREHNPHRAALASNLLHHSTPNLRRGSSSKRFHSAAFAPTNSTFTRFRHCPIFLNRHASFWTMSSNVGWHRRSGTVAATPAL